jgi:hypothetical protein
MTATTPTTVQAKEYPSDDTNKTIGSAWSLDDDDVATVVPCDDVVVEDLPAEYDSEAQVHDQLPSVEDAKLSLAQRHPSSPFSKLRSKKVCLVATGLLALVVIIAISVSASKKNQTSAATYYQPEGRFEEVMNYLFENDISTLPSLEDRKTAEHHAALFIADGDSYQSEMTVENHQKFVERYILALLYYHFNGPEWASSYHFLTGRDHCTWSTTVTRPAGTFVKGVTCNEDGYVTGLDLCKCL